jgi:hypothetical protein
MAGFFFNWRELPYSVMFKHFSISEYESLKQILEPEVLSAQRRVGIFQ